jgi:Na+/serine symporter
MTTGKTSAAKTARIEADLVTALLASVTATLEGPLSAVETAGATGTTDDGLCCVIGLE